MNQEQQEVNGVILDGISSLSEAGEVGDLESLIEHKKRQLAARPEWWPDEGWLITALSELEYGPGSDYSLGAKDRPVIK